MGIIKVRKLAAADMAWAGPKKIVAEYVVGVVLPFALAVLSLRAGLESGPLNWQVVLGLWLIGIALNYIPMTLHAFDLLRDGRFAVEGRPEIARARTYGVQQVMLVVPALVAVLAIAQELERRRRD